MAKVRSIGALATLFDGIPEAAQTTNILVYLFAKLDIGALVISERSTTFAPNHEIRSVADIANSLQTMFGWGELPTDHRKVQWGDLIEKLAKYDVQTDPETLMRLPFEVVPDASVQALFGTPS